MTIEQETALEARYAELEKQIAAARSAAPNPREYGYPAFYEVQDAHFAGILPLVEEMEAIERTFRGIK